MKFMVKLQKPIAGVQVAGLSFVFALVSHAHFAYQNQNNLEYVLYTYMPSSYYQCQKHDIDWGEIRLPLAGVTTGSNSNATLTFISPSLA